MSKYLVETFYTCTFKIVHKLDELNEEKLSELENNNNGKFEIIDVKLNNRRTKPIDEKYKKVSTKESPTKNTSDIPSIVNEKITNSEKFLSTNDVINTNNCIISVCKSKYKDKIILLSAIDNLIKGGGGQAVQNMNISYGFNEREGLSG